MRIIDLNSGKLINTIELPNFYDQKIEIISNDLFVVGKDNRLFFYNMNGVFLVAIKLKDVLEISSISLVGDHRLVIYDKQMNSVCIFNI